MSRKVRVSVTSDSELEKQKSKIQASNQVAMAVINTIVNVKIGVEKVLTNLTRPKA